MRSQLEIQSARISQHDSDAKVRWGVGGVGVGLLLLFQCKPGLGFGVGLGVWFKLTQTLQR